MQLGATGEDRPGAVDASMRWSPKRTVGALAFRQGVRDEVQVVQAAQGAKFTHQHGKGRLEALASQRADQFGQCGFFEGQLGP